MQYLCFLMTLEGRVYKSIIKAENDNTAINRMQQYCYDCFGIENNNIASVMGVWDKDNRFYTAKGPSDLVD
jgi:hypothetical protein